MSVRLSLPAMPRARLRLDLVALILLAGIGVDLWSRAGPAHRYARAIAQSFKTPTAWIPTPPWTNA
jgi:hypothetical protein